jgi:hypothetical protein
LFGALWLREVADMFKEVLRRWKPGQPRRAALIAATSIFLMPIIASNARLASSPPTASASVNTRGVICQETPHLSLHQPHALSWPPLWELDDPAAALPYLQWAAEGGKVEALIDLAFFRLLRMRNAP